MDEKNTYSYKNKWIILITVLLLIFMSTLDGSIVNVALPALSRELGVSNRAVSWVVSSYLITICTVILIFGKLGDITGKTRVFNTAFSSLLSVLFCAVFPHHWKCSFFQEHCRLWGLLLQWLPVRELLPRLFQNTKEVKLWD